MKPFVEMENNKLITLKKEDTRQEELKTLAVIASNGGEEGAKAAMQHLTNLSKAEEKLKTSDGVPPAAAANDVPEVSKAATSKPANNVPQVPEVSESVTSKPSKPHIKWVKVGLVDFGASVKDSKYPRAPSVSNILDNPCNKGMRLQKHNSTDESFRIYKCPCGDAATAKFFPRIRLERHSSRRTMFNVFLPSQEQYLYHDDDHAKGNGLIVKADLLQNE